MAKTSNSVQRRAMFGDAVVTASGLGRLALSCPCVRMIAVGECSMLHSFKARMLGIMNTRIRAIPGRV